LLLSRRSPPTITRSITISNIAASAATTARSPTASQILSFTAAGAGTFAHTIGDALIAFVEQSSKFLKPVYAGDTLYPLLEIAALTSQRSTGLVTLRVTVHNQDGELVLSGEQKILLRKRSPE
jgi:acyl dehydratase